MEGQGESGPVQSPEGKAACHHRRHPTVTSIIYQTTWSFIHDAGKHEHVLRALHLGTALEAVPGHAGGPVTPREDGALSDLCSDSGSSSSSSPSLFVAPLAASPSPSSTSVAQRNRQSLPRWMRRELHSPPGPVPPPGRSGSPAPGR